MTRVITEDAMMDAIAEQEAYLEEVMEGQDFPEDKETAELMVAIAYLEATGVSRLEIRHMTLEDIIQAYEAALQEDAP